MRWALLLVVFLLPALIPMSAGWAEPVGRDGQMVDWTAPNDVYVHQNETVSTYITLHNRADENQALTITPLSVPAPLSTVGLPATELLVPNHLKQVAFGLQAPADAPYQNLTVSFSITSDLSSDVNETVIMNVAIVPRSNLNFGVDDFIAFTVDESVRTAVAVNITNNATLTDDVTFSLYTASTWNWGWNMPDTDGKEAFTTIAPNTLSYVYLWVDVPAVLNGAPLAQTGPRFTLSAVSGLDQAVSTWSFDLLMNEKKNATIDAIEGSLVVAPNEDGRVQAVVRNVGNTPNTLNITLQGLTPEGAPLQGYSAADRFNASGWVVALFGGLEGRGVGAQRIKNHRNRLSSTQRLCGRDARGTASVCRGSKIPENIGENRGQHQPNFNRYRDTRSERMPGRSAQPVMHRGLDREEHRQRLQHLRFTRDQHHRRFPGGASIRRPVAPGQR